MAALKQEIAQQLPFSSVEEEALLNVMRTADCLHRAFQHRARDWGVTSTQYNVLRILRGAEPDGLPTLTIAERVIEKTPGITRMIDRLEAKGLVAREIRSHDRRCVYCRITKKGLKLLELLDRPVNDFNRKAFAALGDGELEKLLRAGTIDFDTALAYSTNPGNFRLEVADFIENGGKTAEEVEVER